MKVHRYLREVVEPYVLPYFNRPIDPIFFKQYNVLPVARVSLNFFEETHVNLVPWLARSSDLLPIEHVQCPSRSQLHPYFRFKIKLKYLKTIKL